MKSIAAIEADFEDRFWSHVAIGDGCWEWQSCKTHSGYGRFQLGGKTLRAHRVSWELWNDAIIPEGLFVMHSCDNPACVKPVHLSVGTCKDNNQDCFRKGRRKMLGQDNFFHRHPRRGETNGRCKLTTEQIEEIKSSKGLVKQKVLAEKYGVSQGAISAIQCGRNWKHLANEILP